ncbi:hypothetical protein BC831DRAFT_483247 [Entophlyctis helioformis]|nr:hypothetical protein BC831DRAFT_483247 [Entophlyctis helioformis]
MLEGLQLFSPPKAVTSALLAEDPVEASLIGEASKAAVLGGVFGAGSAWVFGAWIDSSRSVVRQQMAAKAAQFSGIGAAYVTASIGLAKLRQQNDFWNIGFGGAVSGLVIGLSRNSLQGALAHACLLGVSTTLLAWGLEAQDVRSAVPRAERSQILGKNFFQWAKPDPFAQRIEEIKARDASAAE